MGQYPKIESTGSIGSIILAILEVQVGAKDLGYSGDVGKSWGSHGVDWGRLGSLLETSLPGPQKYVKQWHFWLFVVALGHYFTYFGGPGRLLRNRKT